MHSDHEEIRERLRETHIALNDLLAVFICLHGEEYNTVRAAFDAMERNRHEMNDLPITAKLAKKLTV